MVKNKGIFDKTICLNPNMHKPECECKESKVAETVQSPLTPERYSLSQLEE